jgi:hypothetical protein
MLFTLETFGSSANMSIQIDYRLTGTGWAECNVSSGEQTCLLSASYLSNALRNLILAANGVLAGFSKLTFSFDEEPGEFRWVITSPRLNEIKIEILEFQELWGGRSDTEGKSLYQSLCRPIVFAVAVEEAAKRVLQTHGESGYREKWSEHSFPTGQYVELVSAIQQYGEH